MTTDDLIQRLRKRCDPLFSVPDEDCKAAADRLEALQEENKRLRDGLEDMLDLAEMLAGNEQWPTYKARFKYARAALKGET